MSAETVSSCLAEMEILGVVQEKTDALSQVAATMTVDDFGDANNRKLFAVIIDRFIKGDPVDQAELIIPCTEAGIGELPQKCWDAWYNCAGFDLGRKIVLVRTEALKRYSIESLKTCGSDIVNGRLPTGVDIAGRFADLSRSVIARTPDGSERDIRQLVNDALSSARRQRGDLVHSGIDTVDELLRGLERGELVTIAARTGVGKSAAALHYHVRTGMSGQWSMYVSTEMSSEAVMLRTIAKLSGVPQSVIKGEVEPDNAQTERMVSAVSMIHSSKMLFYDNLRTVAAIEGEYLKQKHLGNSVRLVVVDYIQQLEPERRSSSRQEELSIISRRLLDLAIRENVTVICCAQLNRTSDQYGTPEVSQIKDCGSIEQDSSRIVTLSRDKNDPTMTHLHLLKNRNGELGKVDLDFFGSTMRFYARGRSGP